MACALNTCMKPSSMKEAVKAAINKKDPVKDDPEHPIGVCGECGDTVHPGKDGAAACCKGCGAYHEHEHKLPVLAMKKRQDEAGDKNGS